MSKSIQLKKGTEKYYVHPYFPIGSIYINISNINPSTYFGGTWERLKDRFLLAVGDVYKENTTGGSESVTLTTDQIPSHNHGLNNHTHSYAKANSSTGDTVLTIDQIPSHSHAISSPFYKFAELAYGVHGDVFKGEKHQDSSFSTAATGGGKGHNHSISTTSTNSGTASGNTVNTGGGKSHSNMPPYLTVYMWKRTA